jgi:hypothetical protein
MSHEARAAAEAELAERDRARGLTRDRIPAALREEVCVVVTRVRCRAVLSRSRMREVVPASVLCWSACLVCCACASRYLRAFVTSTTLVHRLRCRRTTLRRRSRRASVGGGWRTLRWPWATRRRTRRCLSTSRASTSLCASGCCRTRRAPRSSDDSYVPVPSSARAGRVLHVVTWSSVCVSVSAAANIPANIHGRARAQRVRAHHRAHVREQRTVAAGGLLPHLQDGADDRHLACRHPVADA